MLALVCGLAVMVTAGGAQEHTEIALAAAAWSADLKPLGFKYDDGRLTHRGQLGIFYTASGQLVAYFLVGSNPPVLERRDVMSETDPYQIKVVVFDGGSGRIIRQKLLPGRFGATRMVSADNGEFLVRSAQTLLKYSPDLRVLKGRHLPEFTLNLPYIMNDPGEFSPGGRHFVLNHLDDPFSTVGVFDGRTLAAGATAHDDYFTEFSISDSGIARMDGRQEHVMYRAFDGPWKAITDRKALQCAPRSSAFVHLLDEQTFVATCGRRLTLLTLAGQVLMSDQAEKNEDFGEHVAITRDGRFFALAALQWDYGYMGVPFLRPRKARILVYDAVNHHRLASLNVEPAPKGVLEYAVSPDGTRLAIMLDDQLRVVSIPAQ
jgi:hypothetical protein